MLTSPLAWRVANKSTDALPTHWASFPPLRSYQFSAYHLDHLTRFAALAGLQKIKLPVRYLALVLLGRLNGHDFNQRELLKPRV